MKASLLLDISYVLSRQEKRELGNQFFRLTYIPLVELCGEFYVSESANHCYDSHTHQDTG